MAKIFSVFFAVILGILTVSSSAKAQQPGTPGEFDFYVLALSWSPTWCLGGEGNRDNAEQCDLRNPRAFVLHGLWPQNDRGWPEFCGGRNPPRVADGTISRMLDIMPSRGLVIHQWRKHGTCSGLQAQAYFDTARRAFDRIVVPERFRAPTAQGPVSPDEVERAFSTANPGLTSEMMSVSCRGGMLEEVRVCLSRTLQPRRCPEVDSRGCRARSMQVPGPRVAM